MNWKDIREKTKNKDRYYEVYSEPESFWTILDPKVVAFTYKIPYLGAVLRVGYSIIGISNRYEPMPIGNRPGITNLWKDKPAFIRYIMWRVRNPWEDARKFYLGFAQAEKVDSIQVTKNFKIWLAKFKKIPFRLPFPYYKVVNDWIDIRIGWKSRGIPSITIRAS